jgi:hypothetical protein
MTELQQADMYSNQQKGMTMEKKEKEVINVKGLGEVTKLRDGVFSMTNAEAAKFFEQAGFPNYYETLKEMSNAKSEIIIAGVENLLKDEVIKTNKDQQLRIGSGDGRIDMTLNPKLSRKNNITGETYTIYGNVRVKEHFKSPFRPGDKNGLFAKLSEEIEKNCK